MGTAAKKKKDKHSQSLPKLVALRIGALILILLTGVRFWKERISPVPKWIWVSSVGLGLWWIFSTFFAKSSFR